MLRCAFPVLGAMLLILYGGTSARCERLPLPGPLQAKVNHAIDRGMVFLETTQGPWGTWIADAKNHPVGYAALPGLTLLECGERADHPSILQAASFVRRCSAKLDSTYDLSLAILFFDRLGDAADEKLIQTLALRLIAGQTVTGGWSYRCPILVHQQSQHLLSALQPKATAASPPSAQPQAGAWDRAEGVPATFRNLPVFQPLSAALLGDPLDRIHEIRGTTDNSNSQFATLALWAARRHGVPMERTLTLISRRFRTSQNPDGSWGYHYRYGGGDPERPPMTCVGLLGLAIGHGLAADQEARENPALAQDRTQAAAVAAFYPPSSFLLLLLDRAEKKQALDRAKRRGKDVQILRGFVALNNHVGEPVERTENIPQRDLYFMWSLERVGVLYDLPTIGQKDWYRWGAEMLVANQMPQGHWDNGGYPAADPVIDTCFALLFLKRGTLVADLTTKLPFDSKTLTASINEELAPASAADLARNRTLSTADMAPAESPEPQRSPAVKPGGALSPQADSRSSSDEAEAVLGNSWLWLLVVLAVLLFIASGVLLTSYSFSRRKGSGSPKRSRHAKGRLRSPHRSTKQ